MTEPFTTTYAKAIDDLAGKIFVPALIASLLVEFGPAYQVWREVNLIETYLAFAIIGAVASGIFFLLMSYVSIYFFKGEEIAPIIGVFIMPIGFMGLFPEQFSDFSISISKVTGVAILAWAFFLIDYKMFKTDV